ncbi:MAG: hypothetical protein H9533_06335 [Rhodobacteraceae bacterium]|nr:hypothetical protein [Paracoccaceae bacterium]
MANFKIDLNTKIVASDTRVFLARAGKNGHMFTSVMQAQAIGPDLPNLELDLSNGLDADTDVEAKIKRSRALASWLRSSISSRGGMPSKEIEDFREKKKNPGHAQIDGIVNSYFKEVRVGDLLVVPNPSFFGEALIAEAGPIELTSVKIPGVGRYEGFNFDGRKFNHFSKVKMSKLPRAVIDLAKAPTGFAEIKDHRVKARLIEFAYEDFVYDSQFFGRIRTTKDDFTSFDVNVLGAFVSMIAGSVAQIF